MTAIALCAIGAEKVLVNELKKLAASGAVFSRFDTRPGQVRFDTDTAGLYHALIGLRTADRLLLQCAKYPARNFDELFDGARAVELEAYIPRNMPLTIAKVRTNRSMLAAETSVQSVTHKAIAERLCTKHGINRLVEGKGGAEFRVYIENDEAEILLDLAGDPLYKRGYRLEGGAAPIRETTAAATILASLWKRKHPLHDPFCGSGTIAIEAALFARNIAPGLNRHFALEKLLIANTGLEKEVRESFTERIDRTCIVRISGSDADSKLISAAQRNAERALGSANQIVFNAIDAKNARSFYEDGFIITNPPYGIRLGEPEDAEQNYQAMSILKQHFPLWKIVVISDHAGFESFFGSKADTCREVSNGAIKLYVYEFEKHEKHERPEKAEKHEKPEKKPLYKKSNSIEKPAEKKYTWTW